MEDNILNAYALGATLYMPVLHPKVLDILTGEIPSPAPSIVLCLEDALAETDVEAGVARLIEVLRDSRYSASRPITYVRPRSLDMAERLSSLRDIHTIDGFVAPKVGVGNASQWMGIVRRADLKIMPTIETPEFFDPARVVALRDIFLVDGASHITAVRLGGNDLLGCLGLRRERGVTAYEGPLSYALTMIGTTLMAAGLPVTAPVYDVISDMETLAREVAQDVRMGFVGKTVIHPAQVDTVLEAFAVTDDEIDAAEAILDRDARAVFQIGGVMCEPATHRPWARRVLARKGKTEAEACFMEMR